MRPTYGAACARVKRARTFGSMNSTVALALLSIAGLLATRLRPLPTPRSPTLQLLYASGMPLLLLGLVLGPVAGLFDHAALTALAPVSALVVGWVGARLGARWDWRMLRRVRPETWGVVAAQAVAGVGIGFLRPGSARSSCRRWRRRGPRACPPRSPSAPSP